MPWPVYLALKHLFPTGRRASFFTVVSILGVTLGVAVLLVVQSVMNGFANEYAINLIRAQGHIQIRSGALIEDPEPIVKLAKSVPGVVSAEPYALGQIMLEFNNRPAFPAARAIAWPAQYPRTAQEKAMAPHADTTFPSALSIDVNRADQQPLEQTLVVGKLDDLDDNSILLGYGLAADLGVHVGDTVKVYTPLMLNRLESKEVLLPLSLTVAGIYQTGWTVADDNTIVVTLRKMQDLYGLDGEVHGVEVRLDNNDLDHSYDVAAALNAKLAPLNAERAAKGDTAPLRALTWLEVNSDLMQILGVEKAVMFYIMIFIVVVASFSIASSLVTSVVRKTREIGVLGALGARPKHIAAVFCLQGFFIGLVGVCLGVALAFLLLECRQPIIEKFVDRRLLLEFYKFLSFPVEYRAEDFIKIILFTLIITTLAGMLPAWRAARLKPAECLRYE